VDPVTLLDWLAILRFTCCLLTDIRFSFSKTGPVSSTTHSFEMFQRAAATRSSVIGRSLPYKKYAKLPVLSTSSETIPPFKRPLHNTRSALVGNMATPQSVASDRCFEEENLPDYEHDQFYPIHLGQKIHSRYQVIGKLGYGSNSTVWFCRDLQ
jgi:hypothetical protein